MDVPQEFTAYLPALLTIAVLMLGIASYNKRIDHLNARISDLKESVIVEIRAEGARLELALGGRLDRIADQACSIPASDFRLPTSDFPLTYFNNPANTGSGTALSSSALA